MDDAFEMDDGQAEEGEDLIYACATNQVDKVRGMLDAGADPNLEVEDGGTLVRGGPLLSAACRCHRAVIQLLLERGADPNVELDGETPLMMACKGADSVVVTMLLDHGADVNARNEGAYNETALHAVTVSKHCFSTHDPRGPWLGGWDRGANCAAILLDRGADITIGRRTPLYHAVCATSRPLIVKLLLDRGAPVDLGVTGEPDLRFGEDPMQTPLFKAAASPSFARLLLAHGADFNRSITISPERYKKGTMSQMEHTPTKTPLSMVREMKRFYPEANAVFDDFLRRYWNLRVGLRLFGSLDEYLLNRHLAPYLIGEGVLACKGSGRGH